MKKVVATITIQQKRDNGIDKKEDNDHTMADCSTVCNMS
jgi:hypothetical protein